MFLKNLFILVISVLIYKGTCLPANTTTESTITVNTPPLIFPTDDQSYTILESEVTLSELPPGPPSAFIKNAVLPNGVTPPIELPKNDSDHTITQSENGTQNDTINQNVTIKQNDTNMKNGTIEQNGTIKPNSTLNKQSDTTKQNDTINQNDTTKATLEDEGHTNLEEATPPHIFPSPSDPRYTFSENTTAMEILQNASEINDLREGGDFSSIHPFTDNLPNVLVTQNIQEEPPANEAEWIEDNGGEDSRKIIINNQVPIVIERDSGVSTQGQTAIILAGVFVVMAAVAYALLITWRRWLERRYGNRELLIEDDDDMKHFSI